MISCYSSGFLSNRFSLKLVLIAFVFLLINNSGYAILKTSTGNGNWNSAGTWTPSGVPAIGDDVTINHNISISINESYTVNSITINGSLTVSGTLTINGNLSTDVDGVFSMGAGAVVIVKGNVLLGNKCFMDLSSYFIVLGNFVKSGSDTQGAITANNAHIYILGTTTAPSYFTVCNQYSGTTTNTSSSCDGGTFDALITNETNNPIPVISEVVQQSIEQVTIDVNNLTSSSPCFCDGGSVTLTIGDTSTPTNVSIIKWYSGTSLKATQTNPTKPYSYPANQADTYNALYKIGTIWYQTNSVILTSKQTPTALISGSTTICSGSSATITVSLTGDGPWNFTYTDGSTSTTVTSQTASPYTLSVSPSSTKTYTLTSISNGCCTGTTSGNATITVTPASVAGTVTPAMAEVCLNTSTTLTLSGYTGSIQWQTNSSGSWQNIPGATAETYNTPNLTTSTSFRAVVTNGICSNATSNEVTITLDQVLPTFSNCPANKPVNVDQGLCSAIVEWDIPTATDNCGTPTVAVIANESITTIGGKHRATIAVGTSTIKYTATDNNGNLQTCTFTITVTDNISPQITCPPGQSVFCAENAPIYTNLAEFTAAGGTATDNCSLNAGSFTRLTEVSNGNVLTRTYQISDAAGNSSTCEQVFTISQPSVSIQSQNTTTCIGGTFSITSTISSGFGAVNYQWQKRANSTSPWNNIAGATSSQLDGTLGSFQEEYRLLVSQTTGFIEACSPASNPLAFSDTQAPVFSGYAPQNQILCTAPGETTAVASGMSIDAIDVIDNCTLNLSTGLSYTITGAGATGVLTTGNNLPENPQFNVGTSTVTYTVSDTYGNVGTHTVTIVVQAAPAPITIAYSSGGNQPTQCSGYTYSVDGGVTQPGYTYEWKVLSGATSVTSGFSVTNAGTASVSIIWTGNLPAGNYTLEAIKHAANGCESKVNLAIALQNSFNLIVNDPGQDCKGESIGLKIIDWQITRPCGTSDYSFKYVIAAGEWNTLSEAQAHQILGMPITISNTSDNPRIIKQTVNYTINVYNTEVFTLFIYDQVDANGQTDVNATDDHHHFYLKGIPETSPISTD